MTLVDLVDAQDARERLHNPGLVVGGEVEAPPVGATPLADAAPAGLNPEVSGEAGRNTAHCHAILVDSSHSGDDDTIRVDAIRTQKGWLGAEIVLASGAEMDIHRDQQQERLIEVKIDGDPIGGAEARRGLLTLATRGGMRRREPGNW